MKQKTSTIVLMATGFLLIIAFKAKEDTFSQKHYDKISKEENAPKPCIFSDFKTYSQEEWSNNRMALLSMEIENIVLGWGANTILFSEHMDVIRFLPQKAPIAEINKAFLNPEGPLSELAGNILALELNLRQQPELKELKITDGALKGMPVSETLALANKILGGYSTKLSPEEMNEVLFNLNQNFDSGCDRGFLICN
jgi:hypothetical protein